MWRSTRILVKIVVRIRISPHTFDLERPRRSVSELLQEPRTTRVVVISLLREFVPTRTTSKKKPRARTRSVAFSITNMPSQGLRASLATARHRRLTRAYKLAPHNGNHRAPKFRSFLTRLPSHLPCDARLISRWLFLFRRAGAFVSVCLVSIDPVGARSRF